MSRIEAWMEQHPAALDRLRSAGVYRADARRIPRVMRPAFRWMRNEMRERVTGAVGAPLIWLNVTPMLRRDDLCDWSCTAAGVPSPRVHTTPGKVWLHLSLPRPKVLLSDFDLWSRYVVHYRYVPQSEDDAVRWDRRVRRALNVPRGDATPSLSSDWPDSLVKALVDSWTRVLAVRRLRRWIDNGLRIAGTHETLCELANRRRHLVQVWAIGHRCRQRMRKPGPQSSWPKASSAQVRRLLAYRARGSDSGHRRSCCAAPKGPPITSERSESRERSSYFDLK